MKLFLLIVKNVRRNLLRSILTALGTMVLVFVVTLVWSILWLLDLMTSDKKVNLKAMVTEKWAIPSRMPFSYAGPLSRGAKDEQNPADIEPLDSMTWQFYGGTLDPEKLTRQNMVFAIGVDPSKVLSMMDGLDPKTLSPEDQRKLPQYIEALEKNHKGIILGQTHLRGTNKRIGERLTLTGLFNYKGINLEFDIVGAFPVGRYDTLAAFHRDYLNSAFDAYERANKRKHPQADRNLNLVWLKVPNTRAYNRIAYQIERSPYFTSPAVKCETASSGYASFLDSLRDLVWGVRWLLAPACLITLSLVIANAISISVRERRMELAVLKVLGFRPGQILLLVLGEALLLGAGAGFASSALTYGVINHVMGGLKFPVAFFDTFLIPRDALWWGPSVGGLAALLGSFLPAWSARNVKVAEVFSKVA
jgi:putative ABC transport system permease protein